MVYFILGTVLLVGWLIVLLDHKELFQEYREFGLSGSAGVGVPARGLGVLFVFPIGFLLLFTVGFLSLREDAGPASVTCANGSCGSHDVFVGTTILWGREHLVLRVGLTSVSEGEARINDVGDCAGTVGVLPDADSVVEYDLGSVDQVNFVCRFNAAGREYRLELSAPGVSRDSSGAARFNPPPGGTPCTLRGKNLSGDVIPVAGDDVSCTQGAFNVTLTVDGEPHDVAVSTMRVVV